MMEANIPNFLNLLTTKFVSSNRKEIKHWRKLADPEIKPAVSSNSNLSHFGFPLFCKMRESIQ